MWQGVSDDCAVLHQRKCRGYPEEFGLCLEKCIPAAGGREPSRCGYPKGSAEVALTDDLQARHCLSIGSLAERRLRLNVSSFTALGMRADDRTEKTFLCCKHGLDSAVD